MSKNIELTEKQILTIKELANKTRKEIGLHTDVPVADHILRYLESKNIIICHYPFKDGLHIDANITIFHTDNNPLEFIGLNSNLYYDEQIFALAHELYHYLTKSGLAYSENDKANESIEKMADRFAAELLLPEEVLKNIVIKTFNNQNLNEIYNLRILRFIALLQIEWWLPYRSVLKRLEEENLLTNEVVENLYKINHRDENSNYGKIFKSINPEIFTLLNSKSQNISISKNVMEVFIRNFEENIISEDEFIELLQIFGKSPLDFGFDLIAPPIDGSKEQIEE
ncbi:MAG: ImmA/IrrE family metallo-endopeptidase [Bacilli bacterium]|nr:ImmA/IrrE family metallo-endopeptidase [Bacilli bacterium]